MTLYCLEQNLFQKNLKKDNNLKLKRLNKKVINSSFSQALGNPSQKIIQQGQATNGSLSEFQQRALMYEHTLTFRESRSVNGFPCLRKTIVCSRG